MTGQAGGRGATGSVTSDCSGKRDEGSDRDEESEKALCGNLSSDAGTGINDSIGPALRARAGRVVGADIPRPTGSIKGMQIG